MDFAHVTAEDILDALPPGDEDSRWELKSSVLLTLPHKSEFKKELGKQVSAFANSGGGNLIFGISTTGALEPCEMNVGRQSMKDYLATMVEQSVEHPIRHFYIHQIPFRANPHQVIFVVEIGDSPAAPHQAKEERTYYYRIDGHSKPAPHFHLELLRHRITKTFLDIVEIDYLLQTPASEDGLWTLNFGLKVTIENKSLQSATTWGVHLKCCREDYRWTETRHNGYLTDGVCVHGEQAVLLPNERTIATVHVSGTDRPSHNPLRMLEEFCVAITPVSQNHVGEARIFQFSRSDVMNAHRQLQQMLGQDPTL